MEDRAPIDFDKYREIAATERALVIQQAIDRLVAWLAGRVRLKGPTAQHQNVQRPDRNLRSPMRTSTTAR